MYTRERISRDIRDRKSINYKRAKLIVAVAYTMIIHTLMFVLIPFNKDINGIGMIWEYVTSLAFVFVVLYIMVYFITFVYNTFIANQTMGE